MAPPAMNDHDDHPVTRRELREELSPLVDRVGTLETRVDSLESKFDSLEGKFDSLESKFDSLESKFDSLEDGLERKLGAKIDAATERLSAELARASLAFAEQARLEIGVLDDRYRDLPRRVETLERELDEHRRDGTLHRSARPPRRRS